MFFQPECGSSPPEALLNLGSWPWPSSLFKRPGVSRKSGDAHAVGAGYTPGDEWAKPFCIIQTSCSHEAPGKKMALQHHYGLPRPKGGTLEIRVPVIRMGTQCQFELTVSLRLMSYNAHSVVKVMEPSIVAGNMEEKIRLQCLGRKRVKLSTILHLSTAPVIPVIS